MSVEINPILILDATSLFETDDRDKEHVGTNPRTMSKATNNPHFML